MTIEKYECTCEEIPDYSDIYVCHTLIGEEVREWKPGDPPIEPRAVRETLHIHTLRKCVNNVESERKFVIVDEEINEYFYHLIKENQNLHEIVSRVKNKNRELCYMIGQFKGVVSNIKEVSFWHRLFNWKNICNNVDKMLRRVRINESTRIFGK